MPTIKDEISIGSMLSIAISIVSLFSIVVTMSVFSTRLRSDVDQHTADIIDLKTKTQRLNEVYSSKESIIAELRTDLRYMKEALQRIERSGLRNQ